MKKNIFPFLPDENLLSNIEYLLKFLRQPLPLDEFFKKFSSDILKARFDQLEFKSENRRSTEYFVIASKAKNKTNTIELTNNDLTCLGTTITDPTHLINPLIDLQKTFPASNLKDALTKLITINNNKIKQININEIINTSKNSTLNLSTNKDKQVEVNIFFNFLKKLIIQESVCKNFTSITSESLLAIANDLSTLELRHPDLNTYISEMHILLGRNSRRKLFNATKVLLAYEKLFSKIVLYFPQPEKSETKIHKIIDALIKIETNSEVVKSNYDFFKLSYSGNKGFRYAFGSEADVNLHKSIQISCKGFSSFKKDYMEIIKLIQELYILADKSQEVINLAKQLNCLTDIYFQTLLDISNSNVKKEYLENCKKNAFIELQDQVMKKIIEFREKNVLNLSQINILYKILNAIAKLIPSFIVQKNTRISFFQQFTPQNKILIKLEETIQQPKL